MYMGPKGSFEPPVSEPKLKVEPIKPTFNQKRVVCAKFSYEEEEEEERDLINDLKRYGRLAVAWNRHGSPVPRWTLT